MSARCVGKRGLIKDLRQRELASPHAQEHEQEHRFPVYSFARSLPYIGQHTFVRTIPYCWPSSRAKHCSCRHFFCTKLVHARVCKQTADNNGMGRNTGVAGNNTGAASGGANGAGGGVAMLQVMQIKHISRTCNNGGGNGGNGVARADPDARTLGSVGQVRRSPDSKHPDNALLQPELRRDTLQIGRHFSAKACVSDGYPGTQSTSLEDL
jgi:hypothetical protein